jgi:uncharacterized protein
MNKALLTRISDGRTDLVFDIEQPNFNSNDEDCISILRWCAYYGDVSAIMYLISKGPTIKSLGENLDLNGAAFQGHWQLCQFLWERGADANYALPETGETPLHNCIVPNRPASNLIIKLT